MPNVDGSETLGELCDRMIRECAMWRERAMRLEPTPRERDAMTAAEIALRGLGFPLAKQDAAVLMAFLSRTSSPDSSPAS